MKGEVRVQGSSFTKIHCYCWSIYEYDLFFFIFDYLRKANRPLKIMIFAHELIRILSLHMHNEKWLHSFKERGVGAAASFNWF